MMRVLLWLAHSGPPVAWGFFQVGFVVLLLAALAFGVFGFTTWGYAELASHLLKLKIARNKSKQIAIEEHDASVRRMLKP